MNTFMGDLLDVSKSTATGERKGSLRRKSLIPELDGVGFTDDMENLDINDDDPSTAADVSQASKKKKKDKKGNLSRRGSKRQIVASQYDE